MLRSIALLILSTAVLAGCDKAPPDSKWVLSEHKDPMNDVVNKVYHLEPTEASYGSLELGCSNGGGVGFYYHFKSQEGIPDDEVDVKVRIDGDPPHTEKWTVFYVDGDATPVDTLTFLKNLRGHTKFAIEIAAAGKDAFEIAGFDQALSDMQETGCSKKDQSQ